MDRITGLTGLYLKSNLFSFQQGINLMNKFGADKTPFLFFVDFDCRYMYLQKIQDIDTREIAFCINGVSNFNNQVLGTNQIVEIHKNPIFFEIYKQSFEGVLKNIKQGNSFLCNLTAATPIQINIDLLRIFYQARAKYKLWVKDKFVCFSPEIFAKIDKNGKISSYPMKGTANANLPNAEKMLLSDRKELWEHTTIVDLIRNDLSKVANKVWVEKFRYLDKIQKHDGQELLQMSSQINGLLESDWRKNLGNIFKKLLPAGSITGAPKNKTIEIIKNAELRTYPETQKRGFYTGIVGIFDGESLDSGVMIRFIEQTKQGLVFKSGGGITFASNAEKEYNEMIQKIYVPIVRNH